MYSYTAAAALAACRRGGAAASAASAAAASSSSCSYSVLRASSGINPGLRASMSTAAPAKPFWKGRRVPKVSISTIFCIVPFEGAGEEQEEEEGGPLL